MTLMPAATPMRERATANSTAPTMMSRGGEPRLMVTVPAEAGAVWSMTPRPRSAPVTVSV
ncbi:hypothetical protein ACFPRL_19240 [Pseudoclavibacter helvolus]